MNFDPGREMGGNSGRTGVLMLVLTKPAPSSAFDSVPMAVEQAVSSYVDDIERTESGATYFICAFAPLIRYSMFAPFSEVEISQKNGRWILNLRLSKLLVIPYAIATFGLLMFRTIGPMGLGPVFAAYGMVTMLVVVAVGEARLRIGWWWRNI